MDGDLVAKLQALLESEREAIRALDGERVLILAMEKEALFRQLLASGPPDSKHLGGLVAELRRNGVLLAHARDVLRDAVSAARGIPVGADPSAPAACLSVRG